MDTSQQQDPRTVADDEFVEFFPAGTRTKGVFQCVSCGEAAVVCDRLARCPSCGDSLWERADWSPFLATVTH